jgi:hypothetical protein
MLTRQRVERRLLREYLDMPGLSLTLVQAARLSSVDAPTCELVLNDLVRSHCLTRRAGGRYVRAPGCGDLGSWKRIVRNRLADVDRACRPPIASAGPDASRSVA